MRIFATNTSSKFESTQLCLFLTTADVTPANWIVCIQSARMGLMYHCEPPGSKCIRFLSDFFGPAALCCWSTPSFLQYRDWPDSNFAFAFSTRIGKILAILRESSEWFPIFPRDAGIVQENLANLANLEAALTLRRVYQVFVALQEEQGLRPSGMAAHALLLMGALLAAARLSPVVTGTRSSR